MSLLDSILSQVKDERKLSDASIKIYKRNLVNLNKGKEVNDLNFLKDVDRVQEILSRYKPQTQNNILQSINRVLEKVDEPELLKFYRDLYYKVYTSIKKAPTDEKTEREEKNWIDWKDVVAMADSLVERANETKDWNDILKALVLGLYAYFEPRRNQDYLNMVVIKRHIDWHTRKLLNETHDTNFLLLNQYYGNAGYGKAFVFNKFKTAKTFGRQVILLDEDWTIPYNERKWYPQLSKLIDLYWKHYPARKGKWSPLLVKEDGTPITSVNAITRILNSIFGKNVGATMLRHSFLTDKYGSNYKDREITSKNMAHSIGTQHKYVKKT
jgi:integrase